MSLSERLCAAAAASTSDSAFTDLLQSDPSILSSPATVGEYMTCATTTLPLLASRLALDALLARYSELDPAVQHIVRDTLGTTLAPAGTYDEQVATLWHAHAALLEAEEEWGEAARALIRIPLDSAHRVVSDEERFAHYVHIIRLFLEDGEPLRAHPYLAQATLLLSPATPTPLQLSFTLCRARLLDHAGKFLDASIRYRDLSYAPLLDLEDRFQSLGQAVICAIIAPAGPQRSRVLATLYKDERSAHLPYSHALTQVFLERIIKPSHLLSLQSALASHHLHAVGGGRSPLEQAVLEHNILALGNIYRRIRCVDLAAHLAVPEEEAEAVVGRMVREGRVQAIIDAVEQSVRFGGKVSREVEEERMAWVCRGLEETSDRVISLSIQSSGM